jgi:oligo-1,6-glucosidase
MEERKFFKENAVYQIYPRSFCDSNGDGIGDLKGIISKLDYLKDLGIGIIWLSPVYPTPNVDFGYDISDYMNINPEYGTLADFDELVAEAKKRGIRIVMDLVVNHTSSEHPWFKASKDPSSPYRDYYIWREGKNNNTLPPNNWTSCFTGPAWTYDKEAKMWYLHLFTPGQPDLNWKNPKVLEEVEKILNFWLDRGVYGFRCDVINQIYKTTLQDGKDNLIHMRVGLPYYLNQQGNHDILHQIYQDVLSKRETMTVGECDMVDYEEARKFTTEELDMVFTFVHEEEKNHFFRPAVPRRFRKEEWKKIIVGWQTHHDWNANYLENHDQRRSINKFGDPKKYPWESGKMLCLLNLFLRGTPFIYEGEEIGMRDYPSLDWSRVTDIVPLNVRKLTKNIPIPQRDKDELCFDFDRDNARSPVQWDDTANAGFSSAEKTWLPVNGNYKDINVAKQEKDPSSLLSFYKEALKIRKAHPTLSYGSIHFYKAAKGVMMFSREDDDGKYLAVINLTKHAKTAVLPALGQILLSVYPDAFVREKMKLRPFEAILVKSA